MSSTTETNIICEINMIDDGAWWLMEINFKLGNLNIYQFNIYAGVYKKLEWEKFCAGDNEFPLEFHCEHGGEGSISNLNGIMTFTTEVHNSGSGGNTVVSFFKIPSSIVLPSLMNIIAKSDENEYFKDEDEED